MNPPRLSSPSAATQQKLTSLWEPARLFLAGLGGVAVVLIFSNFLDEYEGIKFANFLRGQVGFDGIWESALFWKMAIGFLVGAAAGYFVFLEIPSTLRPKANRMALALSLFLIPLIVYVPAMSAGFLWDDDQEVTANRSILHVYPDRNKPAY